MNESDQENTGESSGSLAGATGQSEARALGDRRSWHSAPEVDDQAVKAGTGRDWDQWRELLDAWPGHTDGHTAIAKHVEKSYAISAWWAQTVTVGYERITGLRQPYQQADGTFSISRSRKLAVNAADLRTALLNDSTRGELLPGRSTRLLSKISAKTIRFAIGPGVAIVVLQPIDDRTTKVAIEHKRLPEAADAPKWQEFWSAWLDGLSVTGSVG